MSSIETVIQQLELILCQSQYNELFYNFFSLSIKLFLLSQIKKSIHCNLKLNCSINFIKSAKL